ncbi:diacylglycerol kinase family protein [Oceanobacillus halophilus]|uniref:diacylglycerol kinase family protein n=1 Tax=Oceanobacillus halophilus TaxID=930130 RepID=UPI001F4DABEE|nr:diacylglycerol kinase family protein [Oceanobacillus halophilus]
MKGKRKKIGFSYAWKGLRDIYKNELNFRIHLVAALLVVIVSIFLPLSALEWVLIIFAIGFVLVVEIINSIIERMMDYLKPEYHPTVRFIKDAAAGAVLVTAIVAVLIGIIIFLPKLYVLLSALL